MLARVRRALRSSVTLQTTKNDSQTRVYTGVGAIRGLVRWITGISCRELINGRRFSTSGEERVTVLRCSERKIPIVGMDLSIVVPLEKVIG